MEKPHALPRRPDSYEKQLSDAELSWLHSALLERKLTLEKIAAKLPPWRSGTRAGQRVGLQTLSNIRERLELEDNLAEDGETTQTLIEQLKAEVPGMSDEQIDEIGTRTFSLLSIRRQDAHTFLRLRSAKAKGEIERAKLQLAERAEQRQSESLALEKKRFQRDTCELFLKWAEDQRAKDIAANGTTNSEKIERLGELMFGEDWQA